jgi:uncharacterized membrane protein YfcA
MADSLALAAIVLAAGFLQSLTGFGFALIALPLLGLFLPLKTIIPLVCLLGCCVSLMLSLQLRASIKFRRIAALYAATIPGIPLGVYILARIPAEVLGLILGGVMILFTSYQLLIRPVQHPLGTACTIAAGFLSGVLGGSISAGGPPIIVYSAMQPWSKDQAKAMLAVYFLISGLTIFATHAVSGLITADVLRLFINSIPALVLGIWLGTVTYHRISDAGFRRLAFVLVFAFGLMMIYRSV